MMGRDWTLTIIEILVPRCRESELGKTGGWDTLHDDHEAVQRLEITSGGL